MSAALTTNVDQRLLQKTKFPPEFAVKVDMKKVNLPVNKKWVTDEIARIMKGEDDIVTELIFGQLEGTRSPDIRRMQISLSGFLDNDAPQFCLDLWKLCISAQESREGIPPALLEAKKMELINERLEEERAREAAIKRQEAEREREHDVARIRERERNDRGERGRGRGGRHDRESYRQPARHESRSPSPPARRRGDNYHREPPRREIDSYVPNRSRGEERTKRRPSRDHARRRSPSATSPLRRRRRNTSSVSSSRSRTRSPRKHRSRSAERASGRGYGRYSRGDDRRRVRSPVTRRRSPSIRRSRTSSSSRSTVSRSPPPKRKRRYSASSSRTPPRRHVRSRSRDRHSRERLTSPPRRRKSSSLLPQDDLMSKRSRGKDVTRSDQRRLSQDTDRSASDTVRPRTRTSEASAVESVDGITTKGGAGTHEVRRS